MDRWVRTRWAIVVLFSLLLPACTENADLFRSLDEPEEPSLETVASGSVLSPDETLSVQLQYPEEDMSRATSLLVELRTPEGAVAGELSFSEEQLLEPELPAIELPAPEEGPYLLYVEAMRGEEPLFTEERQIFVIGTPPQIRSIGVYPSTIAADADAVVVAELSTGSSVRPYLRWYFQDLLIGEGYVDAGFDRISFSPDGQVGAHSVRVELFPWGPDEGVRLDQGSSIFAETEAFVRTSVPVDQPPEPTVLRYLLDGQTAPDTDRLDRAFRPAVFSPAEQLDVRTERLGYSLRSGGTVRIPYDIVPPEGRVRRVHIVLSGDDTRDGEMTVTVGTADTDVFAIRLDDAGVTVEHRGEITDLGIHSEVRRTSYRPFPQTLSFSLLHRDGGLVLVPELPGSGFSVLPVDDVASRDTGTLNLSYRGGGTLFIDEIRLDEHEQTDLRFPPEADSLVYRPGDVVSGPGLSASVQVDLRQRLLESDIPEGWFLLWSDSAGIPRYIMWSENDETRAGTIDEAREIPPATPTALLANGSTSASSGSVTVRQGASFETDTDTIVLPEPAGGVWLVQTGRFSSGTETFLSPLSFTARSTATVMP